VAGKESRGGAGANTGRPVWGTGGRGEKKNEGGDWPGYVAELKNETKTS